MIQLFLVSTLVFSGLIAKAEASEIPPWIASWLNAETFLDNTEQKTAKPTLSGWVSSSKDLPNSFGVTFKSGSSEYLLKSASLLAQSSGDPAEFRGEVKVSLYEIPEGKFPPGFEPFFVATQKGIPFTSKPAYVTVPLDLTRLKANSWYAITFTLPNESMAKIVGYQVPNVAPTPFMGFENGVPFWGNESSGWKMLLNPYIQVDGWDVESQTFKTIQKRTEIGTWVVISLLLAIAIFGGLRWMRH